MPDTSMKTTPVVILCGGQGTRMRGSTRTKKELVEIGGRPILWHVMRIFSAHGFNNFVLTLGYAADQIKRYFLEYEAMQRDFILTVGAEDTRLDYLGDAAHPEWRIALIDTGLNTDKASRIARVSEQLTDGEFFVTYGDGVGDVDLLTLLAFHRNHGKLATITAVQMPSQYGVVELDSDGTAVALHEKPLLSQWINAGFMLFNRPVLELMGQPSYVNLETEILPALVARRELMVYRHKGFWHSMDTLKDNIELEDWWQRGAPWKVW